MKWLKIDRMEILILALTAVILVTVALAVGHCECLASVDDCVAASCRVHVPGAVGSGVVIANDPAVYVLTNAHVVGRATKAEVDFWWEANESKRVSGNVIWSKYNDTTDMAIIRIDRGVFGARIPPAIPLAPADYVLPKGEPVYVIGCAHGAWPSAIKGQNQGYSKEAPVMLIKPPVESGRSGSGVFDARGNYLLGLIHQTTAAQARAQYVSLLHARLLPREVAQDTKLFGRSGGFCDRFGSGSQQQTPPPGTGGAYPDLPPLPGYAQQPMVDEAAREEINALSAELADLKADLQDKERRLQELFGGDYALMKQIAADAKAAKETADGATAMAEDAARGVGVVTDALLGVPQTISDEVDAAVAEKIPDDIEDKFGVVRDSVAAVKLRIEAAKEEGAESAQEIAGTVVWGVVKTYAWPIGGALGLAFFLLWRRKQTGESVVERVRDRFEGVSNRIRAVVERDEEDSLLERFANRFRAPTAPPSPPAG
jgi:hypothetical protein